MRSKFWIIFGIIVLILALATIGYLKATSGTLKEKNPKIEISPTSFDFGEVSFGTIAEKTFQLKNSGNEILEIQRVSTSCSCTTAKISNEKLNPGESAELLVTYDTAAMGSGPHGTGKQERIIYVRSNDPINPQIEMTTTAFVK